MEDSINTSFPSSSSYSSSSSSSSSPYNGVLVVDLDRLKPYSRKVSPAPSVGSSPNVGSSAGNSRFGKLTCNAEKLLNDSEWDYSDADIVVDGVHIVGVNRFVLASNSLFFHQLFKDGNRRRPSNEVRPRYYMSDLVHKDGYVGYEAFHLILSYLYSGNLKPYPPEVSTCVDDACSHDVCRPAVDFSVQLMYAAVAFQIGELASSFVMDLTTVVNNALVEDVLPILRCASNCGLDSLTFKCVKTVAQSDFDSLFIEKELPYQIHNRIKLLRRGYKQEFDQSPNDPGYYREFKTKLLYNALNVGVEALEHFMKESGMTLDVLDETFCLHYAVAYCEPNVVKQILDLGIADVNLRNSRGYTVLHVAARRRNLSIIIELLNRGARASDTTSDGQTAVSICRRLTSPKCYGMRRKPGDQAECIDVLEKPETHRNIKAGVPIELNSGFSLALQKFVISEVSPEWGYATEATEVRDAKVPLKIIQEGKVLVEYRAKASSSMHCASSKTEVTKSPEELLLMVRLAQILLSDSHLPEADRNESVICRCNDLKSDEDSLERLIEAFLVGIGTSCGTLDSLPEQLLQDKLHQWLSSKAQQTNDQTGCCLSKKEQGIIHMIAGLGFEWALSPILGLGVSVDFRDINGWTALHWAARFGREKLVATLVASGASSGAVTDPSSQDPTGKTPASIAAASGHKGLAGYLSEVSLTCHLSSLTIAKSDLSEGPVQNEPEINVDETSNANFVSNDDQTSFKVSLAAVRTATQAAARIQLAFREHSFRMRQQREAAASERVYEYGVNAGVIQELLAMSTLLSIRKKHRPWKARKEFLSLRQKVSKIQAHVRGYQVRKQYKMLCWAVGVLEKAVLRWRRRGAGLRGFQNETLSIKESEDEDILKVFRKQKVDGATDESVSRVLSMVDSPEARLQYCRMLEAKSELGDPTKATASDSGYGDDTDMDLFW